MTGRQGSWFKVWPFFFRILATIFVVETIVMLVMQYHFQSLASHERTFLDGILLTLLLWPLLYVVLVRPLLQRKAEYERYQDQLKTAFTELHDRQSFIESVLADIQSGIIVIGLDRRIILANQYALEFFGKGAAEMEGVPLESICPHIDEVVHKGIDADEVTEVSSHQNRMIGFKRFDLKRSDGELTGHIISFVDISEIQKVRREMRQKERLATVGEVVARVAHEMRNPLFGVTAAAQILAMELPLTAGQKELMASILSEARRMNNLVDELLDYSKEIRLKKVPCNLVKLISESLSFSEIFILEKQLELLRSFPDNDISVDVDPERIRQVLINLIKNAVDASPVGGTLTIGAEVNNNHVMMHLVDSGPGIPEGDMEKIFDVFYTTKRSGTGLGLAISRKIMTAHGGTLTPGNDPAGGAIFTITLPTGPTV